MSSPRVLRNGFGQPRAGSLPTLVAGSKTSPAYQLHSYPTKIPPEAIVPFIEAHTTEGAVVLDPFCGSGMTGVAALQSTRFALLSDLSPGAVHLARNHTSPIAPGDVLTGLSDLEQWMSPAEQRLYSADCPTCGLSGTTRHVIWSDVYECPGCLHEVVAWETASDDGGHVPHDFLCSRCNQFFSRDGVTPKSTEPVQLVVSCDNGCSRLQTGTVGPGLRRELRSLEDRRLRRWMPRNSIETNREMYKRSALHVREIKTVSDFYLPRARLALSELWFRISQVRPERVRRALEFAFTNTAWHSSRMRRFNARGGQRPLTGTLYIPQLVAEANVFEVFRHQVRQIARFATTFNPDERVEASVRQSSATQLRWVPDGSIDYVFTDPPFGGNIFYADCNLIWEAWLGRCTDQTDEIVVNKARSTKEGGKTVTDYRNLLFDSFSEIRRVLKPAARASIVFHNSDDQVWSAMLDAAEGSGLKQTDVTILDKGQRSMKGYRGRAGLELVPFYDLVITFAGSDVRTHRLNGAGEVALETMKDFLATAERTGLSAGSHLRSLEYLYSLAVGTVISQGASPDGLSFRAFEQLMGEHFRREGTRFALA